MKATLSKEFLVNFVNVTRYVSLVDSVNQDSKKIIFTLNKDSESTLSYVSSSLVAKIGLGSIVTDRSTSFEIDFDKFNHLVTSTVTSTSNGLILEFEDSSVKATSDVAVVDLLCTLLDEKDSLIETSNSADSDKFSDTILLNEDAINGMILTNSLISLSKNNAGAVFTDRVMYADRSQIYTKTVDLKINSKTIPGDGLILHKNILNLLIGLFKINRADLSQVVIKKQPKSQDSFMISDNQVSVLISNSQASVSLPTDDDLEGIRPAVPSFKLSQIEILDLISFFSGFFVGNSWKPLTFLNNNGKLEIHYTVPSVTNISRKVCDLEKDSDWTSFVIDADNLKNFVSKIADEFVFMVEEEKSGILVQSNSDSVVFAKLT